MRLRIGIDATPIGIATQEKGGMYGTLYHLLQALSRIDETNEYVLRVNFFRRRHRQAFDDLRYVFASKPNFTVRLSRLPNRFLQIVPMPLNLLAGMVDVYHQPSHETYPVWGHHSIMTIHDLRALTVDNALNDEWARLINVSHDHSGVLLHQYRETVRYYQRSQRKLRHTIQHASMIITPSQFTKDAILERFKISEERIRVIPWGISACFTAGGEGQFRRQRLQAYGVDEPFVLAVGRLDPQKNLLRLVQAYARLRQHVRHAPKLVIVGSHTWFTPVLQQAIRQEKLDTAVHLLGYVPDEDLAAFYGEAELLVFPSLFEGFGIPPLEAMACGCPVVASRVTAIPEVVGDAALLVNPYAVAEMAEAISTVLTEPGLRLALQTRGRRRAKPFTWEQTARLTLQAYRDTRGKA